MRSCSASRTWSTGARAGTVPRYPELLNAAGRLCAIQLLAGAAGYAGPDGEPDRDYLGLGQVPEDGPETLRHALGSRLFSGEDRRVPVHRQVAEFLAARYLAGLIDGDHLPAGRVLALMTGGDGGIVSELRGLSAWLAAHSKTSRTEIVAARPARHSPLRRCARVLAGREARVAERSQTVDGAEPLVSGNGQNGLPAGRARSPRHGGGLPEPPPRRSGGRCRATVSGAPAAIVDTRAAHPGGWPAF